MKKLLLIVLIALLCQVVMGRHATNVILSGIAEAQQKELMQDRLSELITEFNRAYSAKENISLDPGHFHNSALKSLNEMWAGKSFICPETELILNLIKRTDGNWEVRNIPILYETKSDNVMDDEIVVIFDAEGVIQGVLIALEREKYIKIFADAYTVQDRRLREIILNFLENFRTAYNRKDITYIEQVFSDDALIIVGRVIMQNQKIPDRIDMPGLILSDGSQVEFVKLSKSQYIKNLRNLFTKNRFVKVEYSDFKIQQHHAKPYIYGVQLNQKWQSSSYSDEGYLFLIIDLRDEDEPIIWVRTWQPGKLINPGDAFDLADFTLN
ncbi:MAG: hypothetical protein PHY24_04110 [Candidatus Cloacimonetes bacterium]|nr:hypothetical protein [Candidatus Cloacimonadota bacterium]MDD3532912.1 hypothetical protein [Candidatus Cloacimonadota bacterium]